MNDEDIAPQPTDPTTLGDRTASDTLTNSEVAPKRGEENVSSDAETSLLSTTAPETSGRFETLKETYGKWVLTPSERSSSPELAWLDDYTTVLDSKFQIPGTRIRFGFDFLLGLIPGVGDFLSLGCSGVLIATMARHGASPKLISKMLVNVVIDAIVGTIPIAGNLFDLFFKANSRNVALMRDYHELGKHQGSAWPIVFAVVGVLVVVSSLSLITVLVIFYWIYSFWTSTTPSGS